jgi:predicted DCC family thiol-disulfide oxidoreductase YuxK
MDPSVIVFDGFCNFCSAGVNFVIKRDKKKKFVFVAGQSERGIQFLKHRNLKMESSVLLISGEEVYTASTAILKIVVALGMPWNLSWVFFLIPSILRDKLYQYISSRRYQWWGKRISCRLPNQEEITRFL